MTKHVYIDAEDISETHKDKFFGLTDKQPVCLRYGPVIKLLEVVKNADGSIDHAKVELLPDFKDKLKGVIHWVSKEHSLNVTLNLYEVLFTIANINEAGDNWMDTLNPNSLTVKNNSKIWNLHKNNKVGDKF